MREGDPELEITLRVVPEAEPITGSVGAGGGDSRWYVGWLELMAAVEALRHPEERET
jgi:hypothetical protein